MIKTIKAGKHRAKPLSFAIYYNKKVIQHTVTFDKSCRYMVDAEGDINKLFGIGYLPSHHTDSCRFGWRYSPTNDKIEILTYCYVQKQRSYEHICFVDFDKEYLYTLIVRPTEYQFICDAYSVNVQKRHGKRFGFKLGTYFGGQAVCPHEMKIEFK